MLKRQYVPTLGKRVKLATWEAYTKEALTPWAWLEVTDTYPGGDLELHVLNGERRTGRFIRASLDKIEKPIGWKERYEIAVAPEKLQDVISWLDRGIAIRPCLDLGRAGTTFYQPMDNADKPHWSAGDFADVIKPKETLELIKIVRLETVYDIGIPAPCAYCVNGTRTPERNSVLVGQDGATCAMCGAISGFSFDKPYHPRINPDHGDKLDSQCASVRPGGQCWVCNGTGKGIAHLNGMGKKQKQAAKEQLEREGWNLTFLRRREACWMGERETVVKDFGQHVKPQFLSDSALLSTTEGGR